MQKGKDKANKGKTSQKEKDVALRSQKKMVNSSPLLRKTIEEDFHHTIVNIRYEDPLVKNRFVSATGTMLSNDLILTVAHILYDRKQGIQFQKQCFKIFEPKQDGFVEKFHKIKDWRYLEGFKTCKNSNKLQYDYALIKIEPNPTNPITNKLFLELRPPCKCVMEKDPNLELQFYGNHEDKTFPKLKLFPYNVTISGVILEVDPSNFEIAYAVISTLGKSGCPVVVGNQIISILNGEACKKEDKLNIGRLITPDLVQNIRAWANQLKSNPQSVQDQILCQHQPILNFNPGTSKKEQQKLQKTTQIFNQISPTIAEALQLKESALKLKNQYKYQLALEDYKKSMTIYEQINGQNSIEAASILISGIGDIYHQQGKQSLALEAFERGKEIYLKKEGEESSNYADSLHRIGGVYRKRAEYDSALDNFKKALSIQQKIKGKDSLQVGLIISNIGLAYLDKRDYPQALQYFKESLKIQERAGNGNSIGAANNHNNIGNVYRNQKKYQLTLQHYEKALEIYQSIKGKDNVDSAMTINNIGIVYGCQEDFPRAVGMYNLLHYPFPISFCFESQLYKRAIDIYKKHQLKHRRYANSHSNLGVAYQRMKDYGSAAAAYRVSLSIYEQMGLTADIKKISLGLVRCLSKLDEVEKEELERIIKKYGLKVSDI